MLRTARCASAPSDEGIDACLAIFFPEIGRCVKSGAARLRQGYGG